MSTLNDLKNATGALKDAHGRLHDTTVALAIAKRDLAAAEAKHTLAGLEGKNEAARRAELAALTADEQMAVVNAESLHREAQLRLTLAELDYKLAREANANYRAELLARAPEEALA